MSALPSTGPGHAPGQGQSEILAAGDNYMHLRRHVLDEKIKSAVYRFGIQHVVIVKNQNEPIRQGRYVVKDGRDDTFERQRKRDGAWSLLIMPSPISTPTVCRAATR